MLLFLFWQKGGEIKEMMEGGDGGWGGGGEVSKECHINPKHKDYAGVVGGAGGVG